MYRRNVNVATETDVVETLETVLYTDRLARVLGLVKVALDGETQLHELRANLRAFNALAEQQWRFICSGRDRYAPLARALCPGPQGTRSKLAILLLIALPALPRCGPLRK